MAHVIAVHDPTSASLDECVDSLSAWGFDPAESESVSHAAHWLRRLANNSGFLGEFIVARLKEQYEAFAVTAKARQITLCAPQRGGYAIRANVWPSVSEEGMYAPAPASIAYGLAHDHDHDFLATSYFGPGYICENFEYDGDGVAGVSGEAVEIRRIGYLRLSPSRVLHYRAGRDIHRLQPPSSLSVTLNIACTAPSHRGQFAFDPEESRISGLIEHEASAVMLRLAVALGSENAMDLADSIGNGHPDVHMRLQAWQALAAQAGDAGGRDDVWRKAESCGNRLVEDVAKKRRGG